MDSSSTFSSVAQSTPAPLKADPPIQEISTISPVPSEHKITVVAQIYQELTPRSSKRTTGVKISANPNKIDSSSTFSPVAKSTPAPFKAEPPIQENSPIAHVPNERKTTVTAQIHREPAPPSPIRTTGDKKRTPIKQYGLDNIEVLESVDLSPKTLAKCSLTAEQITPKRKFVKAAPIQLQYIDGANIIEPNVVDRIDVENEQNDENDQADFIGNDEAVEIDQLDSENRATMEQVLLAKNPSTSKQVEKVVEKPSTSTESKNASDTKSDDPFAFVDDSLPKQRRSGRIGAKKAKKRISETFQAEREMKAFLQKKTKEQPKKTARKRTAPPLEQAPVAKKLTRRLLNVGEYNNCYDDFDVENNCDDASRIARRLTLQRKRQFDELTTSSFNSVDLNNPKARMARVLHNAQRVSATIKGAKSATTALNEICMNVPQRTSTIPNQNVTYSYRRSMTTTTETVTSQNAPVIPATVTTMQTWSNDIEVN